MKTVREIIDAIHALDHIEEEEFLEIQEALNNLAEECGLERDEEESESDYYDYDDDEDEDEEDEDEDDKY